MAKMSFKNFKDYLAERTKHSHGVVSDDKGFANRDYDGGLSLKPQPGKTTQPKEYYAPGANKNPGLMTADGSDRGKALGDLATPGINPKNATPYGEKPVDKTKKIGGKKKGKMPTKKAMKVEHFLKKTKNMSDVQFTKHMLEDVRQQIPTPKVRDLYGNEFVPEPAQTMKYVTQLMLTNENMMRRMVRELKRNNGLHLLLSEVLQQPETYQFLQEASRGHFGEVAQKKIAILLEGISPPRAGGDKGPASAGAPGGAQGGAFGGGGGDMKGSPAAGISGGPDNGGGMNVHNGGGGAAGLKNMGEEGDMGGMGGEDMGDMGGDIKPEDDDEHIDPDDADDDDIFGDDDEDDDDEDDENLEDDDDHGDEEDDHMGAGDMSGMGGMGKGGMGMGGM
jgi:hypothetical protein